MSTLGTLTTYIGIPAGSTTGPKKRKDYASTLKLNIIITSAEERGDNKPNNSNNKRDK